MNVEINCRQCGDDNPKSLGRIPPSEQFAGQVLEPDWDPGSLYECRRCSLGFRAPAYSEAEYETLYARASDQVWVSAGLRRDQLMVRDCVNGHAAGGSVLDVGCYDGSLLAALGPSWQKFGVEASAQAAKVAGERGFTILAKRFRDLAALSQRFEVITAVDVIEHVLDPRAFLEALAQRLVPGGLLVISTGSLDAPAWRLAGASYWYCTIPEHISFVSPAWAAQVADGLNLQAPTVQRFAYRDKGVPGAASARMRFIKDAGAYRLKSWLANLVPGLFGRHVHCYTFGDPGLFTDHVVMCMRKRADR